MERNRSIDDHAWTSSSMGLPRRLFLRIIATLVLSITMFCCTDAVADCIGRKVDVLVDANIPSFFDDKEAAVISARYTPLAEDLIKERPDLGRNLFRQDQAYPATARHMRDVHVPLNLRVINITAEHTWVDAPDELAAMRRAHSEFVAASPNRVAIFAEGSGQRPTRHRDRRRTPSHFRNT